MAKAERNAAIFHGAGNDSKGNWFQSLKAALREKNGYSNIWVPDFPNADSPNIRDWLTYIQSQKNPEFFNNSLRNLFSFIQIMIHTDVVLSKVL
ncbi:hypothetical protein HZA75_04105 [Candidatus Roizmanbacteria bacterium]|nr:hypothetical protein [Candidatus Roizmanbacteria bacterium]